MCVCDFVCVHVCTALCDPLPCGWTFAVPRANTLEPSARFPSYSPVSLPVPRCPSWAPLFHLKHSQTKQPCGSRGDKERSVQRIHNFKSCQQRKRIFTSKPHQAWWLQVTQEARSSETGPGSSEHHWNETETPAPALSSHNTFVLESEASEGGDSARSMKSHY
jgi:hypothetical protein